MRWTDEDTECLITLRNEGWKVDDIASEMGFSNSAVEYRIRKLNLFVNKKWTEEEDIKLIELTELGHTSKECSLILGRHDDSIKSRKVKLKLSKRNGVNILSKEEATTKYIDNLSIEIDLLEYKGVKCISEFKCKKCGHEWKARLFDVVTRNQNCKVCNNSFVSKVGTQWLDKLNVVIREFNIPSTNYRADGFDDKTNTIYEFLGDFWHGNPEVYNSFDIHPIKQCTYSEVYNKTVLLKFNTIKDLGYNICYTWEKDYHEGKAPIYW